VCIGLARTMCIYNLFCRDFIYTVSYMPCIYTVMAHPTCVCAIVGELHQPPEVQAAELLGCANASYKCLVVEDHNELTHNETSL